MFRNLCRAAALTLTVLALTGCRQEAGCDVSRRTDVLLGGGPALCLGGDFGQLDSVREMLAADSVGSDRRERIIYGASEYSYDPLGGIDLIATTIGAKLGAACVRYLDGSVQDTEATVQRVLATGGGSWRMALHDRQRTVWESPGGLTALRFSENRSVCVQVRDD